MSDSIFTGALINDEHTLRDFGAAITNSDVISMPEPNTTLLTVPGRNGRLDLSEVLTGDVSYGNRTLKLVLAAETNIERWQTTSLYSTMTPATTMSVALRSLIRTACGMPVSSRSPWMPSPSAMKMNRQKSRSPDQQLPLTASCQMHACRFPRRWMSPPTAP